MATFCVPKSLDIKVWEHIPKQVKIKVNKYFHMNFSFQHFSFHGGPDCTVNNLTIRRNDSSKHINGFIFCGRLPPWVLIHTFNEASILVFIKNIKLSNFTIVYQVIDYNIYSHFTLCQARSCLLQRKPCKLLKYNKNGYHGVEL